jgi:hypothetical protein
MATLSQWSPYDDYVQSGLHDGRFMSGAYFLVAAGPPRLSALASPGALAASLVTGSKAQDQIAYPIALTQNVGINQSMQLSQFYELGSVRSYFIPGRVAGQISMSRVVYHGPSLLRALYAYYKDSSRPTVIDPVFDNIGHKVVANKHNVKIPPGYENMYLNLLSDLFTQPIGLLFLMKDSNEDTIAAYYAESCYVPSHNIGVDASGVIIQEQVGIRYERLLPIATNMVALITDATGLNPSTVR